MQKHISTILLMSVLIFSCKKEIPPATSPDPISVSYSVAEKKPVQQTIDIFGRFYPQNQIMVFSKIAGKVLKVYSSDGDSIKKGSLLAEVVQEIPGQEYAPYKVTSPIDGTILKRNAEVGMSVTQQTVLFEAGSLECLIFKGQVFGTDRAKIKPSQILELDTGDGGSLSLSISRISPVVDSITGGLTIEAEICFVNASPVFAGQTINGTILLNTSEEIVIPRFALITLQSNKDGVYIIENSKAIFKEVKVLKKDENFVAVRGINSGDKVITQGNDFVSNGVDVSVNQ